VTRAPLAALLIAVAACSPNALAPTPSPSASAAAASPTLAPPPAPTTAASATATARYANRVLGYSVTLPSPWRVSECLSRIDASDPVFIGHDALTWRSVSDEQDLGVPGGTGASGALAWVVFVEAEISSQDPIAFATGRAGGNGGSVRPTTIDGRPAARTVDGTGSAIAYYVANSGRMYSVSLMPGIDARPALLTDAAFDAIAQSVTLTTPDPRPTPTPASAVTAEAQAVADSIATAFAASDADRLRDLMPPKCWFNYGYYQSEGGASSRDKIAAGLRDSFSQGLKVVVEPRPLSPNPPVTGAFWIWSTWSGYGAPPRTTPQSNVQLALGQVDGRWYWLGALYNAAR
jgi:hypothetical protein